MHSNCLLAAETLKGHNGKRISQIRQTLMRQMYDKMSD